MARQSADRACVTAMAAEHTHESVNGLYSFDKQNRTLVRRGSALPRRTASTQPLEWRPVLADTATVDDEVPPLLLQHSTTASRLAQVQKPHHGSTAPRPLRRPRSPLDDRQLQQQVCASARSASRHATSCRPATRLAWTRADPTSGDDSAETRRTNRGAAQVLAELALQEMTKKSSHEFEQRVREMRESHAALKVATEERLALGEKCLHLQADVEETSKELKALQEHTKVLERELSQSRLEKQSLRTEVEALRANTEEPSACVICLAEQSSHIIVPCGHMVLCGGCSLLPIQQCPVCRRFCEQKIRVFRS
eukprot:TRINITY_DN31277_c0_g1_i2.p1 TRINITY_DN31277_c0_g1~~TRINITY_DN31277_c0_g1_i2.p1  ORF type:complete len:310 (-),score=53.85 TRINITY_DN31277_c0_g1_i2:354-1283(-)